ncbi:hypothetical protein MASR1M107_27740 [Ignavibacteriales bacterium]
MRGSVAGLFLYTFLFGMSSLLLGMLVSVILKNVMLSTQVVLFLTTPAFVFSGLTYPLWAMPEAHRIFSHVIPYTQFLDGFIRIYLMGENLSDIGKSIDLILAGIVAPLVLIPLINFTKGIIIKRKMRNQR